MPLKAALRDVAEGANACMVKPSIMYCDLVQSLSSGIDVPVAAYVVSGEFKMLSDYGSNCDCLEEVVTEAHVSLLRSGASILVTYFAPQILGWGYERERSRVLAVERVLSVRGKGPEGEEDATQAGEMGVSVSKRQDQDGLASPLPPVAGG